MSNRFDTQVDLSTPPTALRWDLGERSTIRPAAEKVCGVRLGKQYFAIAAPFIRGLRQIESLTSVPRLPAQILGVTPLHGAILPLLDPGPVLGVKSPRQGPPWTSLWIEIEEQGSVLLAVDEVVAFEPHCHQDKAAATPFSLGETTLLGGPVTLLDLPRLLKACKPPPLVSSNSGAAE